MRKIIGTFFLFLSFNFSFAQNQEEKNQLWVINLLGAKLHEKPSFPSKILKELEVGEIIIANKKISTSEKFKIGRGFELAGDWIKTNVNGITGFIFSSDLSVMDPKVSEEKSYGKRINLFGKLQKETSETKQVEIEPGTFPMDVETKFYENGIYYYSIFDGCFNHEKTYKNLKLNEVYHQMISDYAPYTSSPKGYLVPKPIEHSQNTIKFETIGATQNLRIEILNDGTFKVSSYDCT